MTENQLIEEIRNGNQALLGETYHRYRKEFVQWAFKSYNCSIDDSKEIYQIAFFLFYDNVLSGKLEHLVSNLKTYLFAIGKHKILENNRRNNRFALDIKEDILRIDEDDQELRDHKEQQYQQISQGLQELGDQCKEILELMYYHNWSIKDITKRFGFKNPDTTKNQKYKCMQRLKKIVEKNNCMKLNQEDMNSIKIQRYLDGDMSGAERTDFEKELAVDPGLMNLTDSYRNLVEGVRYHARQKAWNTIQQLEAGYAGEEIQMRSSRKIWPAYAVAAGVAIIAIAFAYNNNLIFNRSDRIFDEHFAPYQALVNGSTRSEAMSESQQARAFSAYSNDNYQQAIALFEEIDALEDDPLIWFYLGNSYLALDKPEDAINYFLEVLSQDTALTPQARWYLGLSYLANRDIDEARKVFEALANDATSYGERAKSILNQF